MRSNGEMTATGERPLPSLTPEQVTEVLSLVSRSDSVELKLTVSESEQRSAVRALGMDPLDAEIRQVFFFDTPDLALSNNGVVVPPAVRRVAPTTPSSSSGRSSRPTSLRSSGRRPASASRSTACREASCARRP